MLHASIWEYFLDNAGLLLLDVELIHERYVLDIMAMITRRSVLPSASAFSWLQGCSDSSSFTRRTLPQLASMFFLLKLGRGRTGSKDFCIVTIISSVSLGGKNFVKGAVQADLSLPAPNTYTSLRWKNSAIDTSHGGAIGA